MASRRKGRILAFQSLYSWEASGRKIPVPEELLNFTWLESEKRETMDPEMGAFSRLLLAGTVENIAAIDDMIKGHLQNWDISRLGRVDLALLRLSVYSLMYQEEMHPSIVIDEAIGIAREFGAEESFRFVNGVLDSIRKTVQGEKKPPPLPASPAPEG